MYPPAISLLVYGIKTPLTYCSGNAILKRDSSVISEIYGQLCSLHTPLVLPQFTSSLLVQMVGVTQFPMVWVAEALGWAFSGAGLFSSSTSIPWWWSSAISCVSPALTFGGTSVNDSRSAVVRSCYKFCGASTTALTTISSSKGVEGASSILKFPQKMWKTVPLSISGILHSYHCWSFQLTRWSPFSTSKTSQTRLVLWLFGHFLRMCWLGWKNFAWADTFAPMPPGSLDMFFGCDLWVVRLVRVYFICIPT